jgi:hypothetical protein
MLLELIDRFLRPLQLQAQGAGHQILEVFHPVGGSLERLEGVALGGQELHEDVFGAIRIEDIPQHR